MAYALGHISGGRFNPAVTVGLALARRLDVRDVLPYVVTQVVAAVAAAAVLYVIANGAADFSVDGSGFAARTATATTLRAATASPPRWSRKSS